jgi:hypothetical protein
MGNARRDGINMVLKMVKTGRGFKVSCQVDGVADEFFGTS